MSTAAAPKETLPFTAEQKHFVGAIAWATQMVAVALLLLAVLEIIGAVAGWLFGDLPLVSALVFLVLGVLMKVFGLVLLAVASDFKFLGQFPQFSGNHLRNLAKNMTVFCQIQIGLAVLVGLVALGRFLVWWTS